MADDRSLTESESQLYTKPEVCVGFEVPPFNYRCTEAFASSGLAEDGSIRKIRIVRRDREEEAASEVDMPRPRYGDGCRGAGPLYPGEVGSTYARSSQVRTPFWQKAVA